MALPAIKDDPVSQSDRALVLDLLAAQHASGRLDLDDHPALDIWAPHFCEAWDSLVASGFVRPDGLGCTDAITPAGLAAHADAQRAAV